LKSGGYCTTAWTLPDTYHRTFEPTSEPCPSSVRGAAGLLGDRPAPSSELELDRLRTRRDL
jgi:hypothetical protein